jgi:phosphoenolpyruvate carboxykinase (GTP)
MADYFAHWLRTGEREGAQLPRVFLVNWFRKDDEGHFIWPGYGENSRVLEWVFRRCEGEEGEVVETPIGLVPTPAALNTNGLELGERELSELLSVDSDDLRQQLPQVKEHLARFGDRLPPEVQSQLEALERRLDA